MDVVNNSPRLERMPVFGRSLILLPAFAVILLLSAAGFAFAKPRASTAADAGSANVDPAIRLCLLGAAALFTATVVIGVVRIAGSRRATDPVASRP